CLATDGLLDVAARRDVARPAVRLYGRAEDNGRLSAQFVGEGAKQRARLGIHVDEGALIDVEHHDGFGRRLDERAIPRLARRELTLAGQELILPGRMIPRHQKRREKDPDDVADVPEVRATDDTHVDQGADRDEDE